MIFRTLALSIFALTLSVVNADISPLPDTATVYEDAEQGTSDSWGVYDNTPAGAIISNVFDADKDSSVIEFSGGATSNGYRLGHNNANNVNAWSDTNSTIISWDSKFSESMVVYIPVETTDGFRYLYYTARNNDLGIHANPTYIHHGIGANQRNGTWHTTARDLEADLKEFEPSNSIISVNGFLIRGSGRVDNIATLQEMPPVLPVPEQVIYEDAENGDTVGWDVYDKTPEGATFSNVDDADSGSKVIQLSGSATSNGYRLGHNNANHPNAWNNSDHKTISWDSKFSEAMVVYVPVQTTNGFRYLYYTAIDDDRGIHSNPTYIHHGIGENQKNGTWHTNVRDLQADLHDFEPDNQIITVNGILIRGSGRVDNIKLSGDVSPPESSYEIRFVGDIPATTVPRNLINILFELDLIIIASVVDDEGNPVADAVPTYDVSTVDLTTAGNYSLTFSYSYINASGDTVTITKDLGVIVENHLPSAAGQSLTVEEDTSDNAITLTGHDANTGDTLTYEIATQPANGTLGGTAPNVTYTPNENFFGTDSFTFTLSDNTETSAPATVNINVTDVAEPNTAPVAIAQVVTINEGGGSIEITILGTDADGDPLHYSVTSSPDGFLSGSTGGTSASGVTLTYDAPNSNYFGTTSFTFTVSDGTVTSAPATVVINVTSVNDVPTIGALDRVYLDEDSTGHAITLAVNDVEGDPLTYTIVGPNNGVLSGTAPSLTYTPNENYFGTDSFTITANDGTDDSLPRTIDITVNSINDAPTVNAGADTSVQVNSAVALTGVGSDIEGAVTYSWAELGSDAEIATTASFSYTPTTQGDHTLTLTVTDSDGATASDTVLVVATVPGPYSIVFTHEVGFRLDEGSTSEELRQILSNIGHVYNGAGVDTGVVATEYSGRVDLSTAGRYPIRLVYTDPFGRLVESSPIDIMVIAVVDGPNNPAGDPTDITFDFGNPLHIALGEYQDLIFDDVYYEYLQDQMHVVNDNGDEYTVYYQNNESPYDMYYDDHDVNLSVEGTYFVNIVVDKEVYYEAEDFWDYEIVVTKQLTVIVGDPDIEEDVSRFTSHVVSTEGEALAGVRVDLIHNGVSSTVDDSFETDANGNIDFHLSAGFEFTFVYTKDGYATQVVPIKTPLNSLPLNLEVTMIPRALPQAIPETGEVIGSDGAKVIIQDNAFVDAQGNPVSIADGITVTITPVDVSTPVGVAAFPGEFSGIPAGQNAASPIVSYGTVEYVFRDSNGNELQLASEQFAIIEIPLFIATNQDGTTVAVDDLIPLWSLDELTGIWTQEGVGIVVASAASPTGFALKAGVDHFTWWNADAVMNPSFAIVTVTAPEAGTALIKIRTTGNVNGWRSGNVNTVIPAGSSSDVLPIPSNTEVCFWAVVTTVTGSNGTTEESCVTVAPNSTENISLAIVEAPLELSITPATDISTYINVAPELIVVSPTTAELSVNYVIESGSLPAGVELVSLNATTASIVGAPTEAGIFNPVIKGTDADGNEFSLPPLNYTVTDGVQPPSLLSGRINREGNFEPSTGYSSFIVYVFDHSLTTSIHDDLNLANSGGDVTDWSVSFNKADLSRQIDHGINTAGYSDKIQDLSEEDFEVSMDSATGILTITWPNEHLLADEARLISLYFTLTATNAGGSSSVELFVWKQNDGEAVIDLALPRLSHEYYNFDPEFLSFDPGAYEDINYYHDNTDFELDLRELSVGAPATDFDIFGNNGSSELPEWLNINHYPDGSVVLSAHIDDGQLHSWEGTVRASNDEGYYESNILIVLGGDGDPGDGPPR